ncbi:ABC transporter permease [Polymorphospora sp. NPDC051019]|uniref:ABC transporter permease n=1 Tax=Polymorphospora sp. NPDC051019 TaxID=3155725 RepID=UPI00343B7C95
MSAASTPGRRGSTAWIGDLVLGVRLSVAGGRYGWARLAMIAVGVGLGVAMLLAASAVPTVGMARSDRSTARTPGPEVTERGSDTLLTAEIRSHYRNVLINGRLLWPEGEQAPLPPGVPRQLAHGEMIVSPALAELLNSPGAGLLRERWDARVVGIIEAEGLVGPRDHFFYLGSDRLTDESFGAERITAFGGRPQQGQDGLPLVLLVLAVLGLVVLLLPVLIFVTTAVRFGSEARDRQLAAIRLVGADGAMTRRIAAGETLVGTALGMAIGALVFLGAGQLIGDLLPARFGFFPADLRPVPTLAVLIGLAVPTAAVLVTLSALRRVMIEPLGVVRRGGERRRRLWWRLIPPAVGLLLLYPLLGDLQDSGGSIEAQVTAGVTLLLVGVVLLLPWLVQVVVRRLGGGGVAWELAVRRLQLDSDTAVRAVAGIAVSVAGVIAVQGVLGAAQAQLATSYGPTDRFQATMYMMLPPDDIRPDLTTVLTDVPGVRAITGVSHLYGDPDAPNYIHLRIADCNALRQYAELPSCTDGDSFATSDRDNLSSGPASTITVRGGDGEHQWTVPADIRTVRQYDAFGGADFLLTPAALGAPIPAPDIALVGLDPGDPEAIERVRNVMADIDPFALVQTFDDRRDASQLATFEQALRVGAVALLVLIGASMLVNIVEQLRERRRLLAALTAVGTRRRTLSESVVYQVAIPVLLGLILAVTTGGALAAVLLAMVNEPISFNWAAIAGVSGTAAVMVLAVTAGSLPLLWRLTRAEGLRTE